MIRMAYATTVKQHVSSIFDGIFMICALARLGLSRRGLRNAVLNDHSARRMSQMARLFRLTGGM